MYSEKLETEIRVIRYLLDGLSSMYGNIYDTIAEHIKFTNKREEVNETAEEDVPDDNERIEFDVDADNLTADEIAELNAELVRSFNEANGLNSSLQNQEIDNEKLLENLEEEIMNNSKKPKNSPGYLTKEGLRQIIFPSIK
jgi:alcohol dehydrogenase class IV